jgi:hypothetical protein
VRFFKGIKPNEVGRLTKQKQNTSQRNSLDIFWNARWQCFYFLQSSSNKAKTKTGQRIYSIRATVRQLIKLLCPYFEKTFRFEQNHISEANINKKPIFTRYKNGSIAELSERF